MATTLVTGGAGFIGSHLTRALLNRGDSVRVLDDLSTGSEENISDLDMDLIVGDIRDRDVVRKAMQDIDFVFHLAAMISAPGSLDDPHFCYSVNVDGSLNVLWEASKAGVKRVVLASSAAIYGETTGKVDETMTGIPQTPYGSSKVAMEHTARMFGEAYGLATTCLRYFNVYGPRQSPDSMYAAAIPIFIQTILSGQAPTIFGDGEQRRDFVFVDDVVRASIMATEKQDAVGHVFNVGSGTSVSILDLVHSLQQILPEAQPPTFGPPRAGDVRFSEATLDQSEAALGYRPQIALKEGLGVTVQWFRSQMDLRGS
jgi:nucleoside-diphosphate-sugar epimerase